MRHRRPTRTAAALTCAAVAIGVLVGMVVAPFGQPAASATADARVGPLAQASRLQEPHLLERGSSLVFGALNAARAEHGLAALALDAELAASARRDACAIARGELPLTSDGGRLAQVGADAENVGLVVDADPTTAAHAMHAWWSDSAEHRADRMDPSAQRYGIGACTDDERTYYVERFAA